MKKTIKFEFKEGFDEMYFCRITEQSHIRRSFSDTGHYILFENYTFSSENYMENNLSKTKVFFVKGDFSKDGEFVIVTKQEKELLERFEKYYNERFSGDEYKVEDWVVCDDDKVRKIMKKSLRNNFVCYDGYCINPNKIKRKATLSDIQQAVKDMFKEYKFVLYNNMTYKLIGSKLNCGSNLYNYFIKDLSIKELIHFLENAKPITQDQFDFEQDVLFGEHKATGKIFVLEKTSKSFYVSVLEYLKPKLYSRNEIKNNYIPCAKPEWYEG